MIGSFSPKPPVFTCEIKTTKTRSTKMSAPWEANQLKMFLEQIFGKQYLISKSLYLKAKQEVALQTFRSVYEIAQMFGGVSESSGSPLVDGHRDFQNRCRNGWENWSWSWQPSFGKWQTVRKLISVFKVPTSTSIFSAISASILKISVPINKRRSWRFQNTPRSHLSDEF